MLQSDNSEYIDKLILEALRRDDEEAIKYLFTSYYNKLYRTGLKYGADGYACEEAVQDVFQDIWTYRNTLGDIQSFEAYLKVSLRRKLSKKISKNPFEELQENVLSVDSYEDILIQQEVHHHQKENLQKALNSLSPRQKELVVLKYFEELSYEEMTLKTGLQIDYIYKVLHEALKKLRFFLKKS